ncbi:MAG: acyl-CoA thioesterase YbgC [Marmoricola sp.]|nr:acyl-CoA thioesterase YbgC [Marmoricola sp.]
MNNVTYVDLLQEARIAFFGTHRAIAVSAETPEGILVVKHEVDFLAPLTLRRTEILVDTWVAAVRAGSFILAHEIYQEDEAGRTVYARASTLLAPFVFATAAPRRLAPDEKDFLSPYLAETPGRTAIAADGTSRHLYPLQLRWSEMDPYKHANNVHYYEYFQEARVAYIRHLHTRGEVWSENVIARMDVDYLRPLHYRSAPYEVHSWISGVGTKAYTVVHEIRDEDEVLARSKVVMVTFDTETQRATAMAPEQRAALTSELPR